MKWMSVLLVAVLPLLACTPSAAAEKEPAKNVAPATRTTRVVFIDKEKPCACTQKKIDAAWAALQAVNTAKLPVERLHIDTQFEQTQVYRSKKPLMALPAIYYLDAKGEVVEMLQGEVTEAQVRSALK